MSIKFEDDVKLYCKCAGLVYRTPIQRKLTQAKKSFLVMYTNLKHWCLGMWAIAYISVCKIIGKEVK